MISQPTATTGHQITNRTTTINEIITEQIIIILMLVRLAATQYRHMLASAVFKSKRMTSVLGPDKLLLSYMQIILYHMQCSYHCSESTVRSHVSFSFYTAIYMIPEHSSFSLCVVDVPYYFYVRLILNTCSNNARTYVYSIQKYSIWQNHPVC